MTTISSDELSTAIAQLPGFGWGPVPGSPYTPLTQGYWEAAGRGELAVQQCDACRTFRWPPNEICYECSSMQWHWQPVPGEGTVYSYFWADHVVIPGQDVYNMSIVELPIQPDAPIRLMTNVVNATKQTLDCGLAVTVHFEPVGAGLAVPLWRLPD
jgi:uncharacterized OB-fold protein